MVDAEQPPVSNTVGEISACLCRGSHTRLFLGPERLEMTDILFALGRTALPFGEPPEAAAGICELRDNLIDTTGRFRASELRQ